MKQKVSYCPVSKIIAALFGTIYEELSLQAVSMRGGYPGEDISAMPASARVSVARKEPQFFAANMEINRTIDCNHKDSNH